MRTNVVLMKNGKAQLQVRDTVASSTGGVAELFLGFSFNGNIEDSQESITAITKQVNASHLVREFTEVEPQTGKWSQVMNPTTSELLNKWQRTILVAGAIPSSEQDVTDRVIKRNQQVASAVTQTSDSVLD